MVATLSIMLVLLPGPHRIVVEKTTLIGGVKGADDMVDVTSGVVTMVVVVD